MYGKFNYADCIRRSELCMESGRSDHNGPSGKPHHELRLYGNRHGWKRMREHRHHNSNSKSAAGDRSKWSNHHDLYRRIDHPYGLRGNKLCMESGRIHSNEHYSEPYHHIGLYGKRH